MGYGDNAGGAAGVDREQIRKAIALFRDTRDPALTMEIRAVDPYARVSLRRVGDLDGLVEAAAGYARTHKHVYFGLNPRTLPPGDGTVGGKKKDVPRRRWLAIDIDPVRDADTSSTDGELAHAAAAACSVEAWGTAAGWPEPWRVLSGNGYHLYWMIDLPADDGAHELVKGVIDALARLHNTGAVKIDPAVCDSPRIMRLPGTVVRKGVPSPERPHRTARIENEPESGDVLTEEQMREFVEANRPPEVEPDRPVYVAPARAAGGTWREKYRNKALNDECARVTSAASGGRNNALNEAAFALGRLVGGGVLSEGDVIDGLMSAADAAGLDAREIPPTIKSGLDSGKLKPRGYPERSLDSARNAGSLPASSPPPPDGPRGEPLVANFPEPGDPWVPFPLDVLPRTVRDYVVEHARSIGCDQAALAVPAIAALGAAIGNTRQVQLGPEWQEVPILWSVLVSESGAKKSPALRKTVSPLRKLQARWDREYREGVRAYEEAVDSQPKAGRKGEDAEPKPREPVERYVICSDVTIEWLALTLKDNPRGVLVCVDELAQWLASFSRYKSGDSSDLSSWLGLYSHQHLSVNRAKNKGKGTNVPTSVCICGGIQPDVLAESLNAKHFRTGMVARLLLAWPPLRLLHRCNRPVPAAVKRDYEFLMLTAAELGFEKDEDGEDSPRTIPMTPEAQEEWDAFERQWRVETFQETGEMREAYSKLEAVCGRWALAHHVAQCIEQLDERPPLGVESLRAGIRLTRWFADEARRIYRHLGLTTAEREHLDLVTLLERLQTAGTQATAREVMRKMPKRYTQASAAVVDLEGLVRAGLAVAVDVRPESGAGRPTRVYLPARPADS